MGTFGQKWINGENFEFSFLTDLTCAQHNHLQKKETFLEAATVIASSNFFVKFDVHENRSKSLQILIIDYKYSCCFALVNFLLVSFSLYDTSSASFICLYL